MTKKLLHGLWTGAFPSVHDGALLTALSALLVALVAAFPRVLAVFTRTKGEAGRRDMMYWEGVFKAQGLLLDNCEKRYAAIVAEMEADEIIHLADRKVWADRLVDANKHLEQCRERMDYLERLIGKRYGKDQHPGEEGR